MAKHHRSLTPAGIAGLLEEVASGKTAVGDALGALKRLPFTNLEFARVDHHRELRSGTPEAVFCEGKTAEQIAEIAATLIDAGQGVLATRLDADKAAVVYRAIKKVAHDWNYNELARVARISRIEAATKKRGPVAVISAGTSDQAVAQEAVETLTFMDIEVLRFNDVGVAGIHRLLASAEEISGAIVAIVVAGMEGALPSVVGGLVDMPVIAVPTSVGYGAAFGGLAALLGMMNTCSAGVTVVNIDNGFGAASAAALILRAAGKGDSWTF